MIYRLSGNLSVSEEKLFTSCLAATEINIKLTCGVVSTSVK